MKEIFLAMLLFCGCSAWAVDAPPDPQLALPDNISYTKSFTYPVSSNNKTDATPDEIKLAEFMARIARLDKVEITKSGNIQREKESYTDGSKREVWRSGEIGYVVDPSVPEKITVVTPQMGEESSRSLMGGAMFSEVSWVNADAFQGEGIRKGVACYIYKTGNQQVWVEKASKLPVFLQSPEMQVDYTYKPTTEILQLPANFARKREAVERAWRGQR